MSRDDRSDTNYPEWDEENPVTKRYIGRKTPRTRRKPRDISAECETEAECDESIRVAIKAAGKAMAELNPDTAYTTRHLIQEEMLFAKKLIRELKRRKRRLYHDSLR